MRLAVEFVKVPVCFDVPRLIVEVSQFDDAEWFPHPQGHPGNTAIPLIAAHGDPSNNATKGPMLPTPALDRCPYLRQVLASFQTVIGRTRLMRLDANAEATPHVDTNYYWFHRVRVHVPILTAPSVQFVCGGRSLHMGAGEAWIFDTWKPHNVVNPNATQRVHLVADSVGAAAFWELVAQGESPVVSSVQAPAVPRFVPFVADACPDLMLERVNQPVVMSPWEQTSLLTSLFDDLATSEGISLPLGAELRQVLTRFQQDWRALWARYGGATEGWPAYQMLLRELEAQLPRFKHRFSLPNRADAVEIIRQMVIRPALNPELTGAVVPEKVSPSPPAKQVPLPTPPPPPLLLPHLRPRIEQPIFIVSPPRSGSTLLFETLAQSPTVYTIGKESHALIESIPRLHPAQREFSSNRLTEEDVDTNTVERLCSAFLSQMHDRNGKALDPGMVSVRLLEKTPKNALRVPFFQAIFPDACFIYLYRDPREEISSMMDAWRSGRFVTYPRLPGWPGLPWSLVLVPGWREMIGRPLAEIVARQWATTTRMLLDDLTRLPPQQWCVASYDRLVSDPQTEVERLCHFVNIAWDRHLTAPLPLARHTLTPPDRGKWRQNEAALTEVLPLVADVAARARDFFARAPVAVPVRRRVALPPTHGPTLPTSAAQAASQPPRSKEEPSHPLRSGYTASVPEILQRLHSSLLVSTYQSGQVIAVREDGGRLNTHFRNFQSPMGIAVGAHSLAVGTQHHVWEYRNQPAVARKLEPLGKHDACFLPRTAHVTGDIRIHELAFAGDELWLVNTRFSCLCTLDGAHSFVPRWRPRFVSHLAAEDRCHLNGMAVIDQRVRFVTALGQTNTQQGWREQKARGGCVIDVESGEMVVAGLSMPHSPRWYDERLWVLESGKGTLATLDIHSGHVDTVVELPGFTRGLAFAGPYAFIGLSQVRESVFGGIPLTERLPERACGVWVVNIRSGHIVGFLRFSGVVQEIFDIQVLAGLRFPDLSDPDGELIAGAYVLPREALAEVWQGREMGREQ